MNFESGCILKYLLLSSCHLRFFIMLIIYKNFVDDIKQNIYKKLKNKYK